MSGMHSDNYELSRSSAPQSVKDYSAFTDKQWNTKPDTSGGVYQSQNSLVEFDIGSLFKSDAYSDISENTYFRKILIWKDKWKKL